MLDILSILNKWAEIAEYDENQTSFNMLSHNYAFHKAGDAIKEAMKYDGSGVIPVLYAKYSFENIMKDCKVSVLDYLKSPTLLDDYLSMWNTLECKEMKDLELNLMNKIKAIKYEESAALIDNTLSADTSPEDADSSDIDRFRDSVEYVVEDMRKLRTKVFKKYNQPISDSSKIRFVNRLFVLNTVAEALLRVEQTPSDDVLYLCYISDNNSAAGHFMFLLKSNGNIIGFTDRVDESYMGAHEHHRNGRWQENKCYHIFPYDSIVEYEGSDYKGYPKQLKVINEGLHISELSMKYIYRIAVTAMLLISRYSNSTEHFDEPLSYVHSLVALAQSLEEPTISECTTLTTLTDGAILDLSKSVLAVMHRDLGTDLIKNTFTASNVKSGEFTEKFNNMRSSTWTSYNQLLIDAYGDGFELSTQKVLPYDTAQLTIASRDVESGVEHVSEYVADRDRFELEIYRNYRKQLAEYIQAKVDKEYEEFGGYKAVRSWYKEQLAARFDYLVTECVKYYVAIESGQMTNNPSRWHGIPVSKDIVVGYEVCESWTCSRSGQDFILNPDWNRDTKKCKCPITGCNPTIWIQVQPCVVANIQKLLGEDVKLPRILTGWTNCRSNGVYTGNSILNSTDPVAAIDLPLRDTRDSFDFSFTIGLSKSGINKAMKELGLKIERSVKHEDKSL